LVADAKTLHLRKYISIWERKPTDGVTYAENILNRKTRNLEEN